MSIDEPDYSDNAKWKKFYVFPGKTVRNHFDVNVYEAATYKNLHSITKSMYSMFDYIMTKVCHMWRKGGAQLAQQQAHEQGSENATSEVCAHGNWKGSMSLSQHFLTSYLKISSLFLLRLQAGLPPRSHGGVEIVRIEHLPDETMLENIAPKLLQALKDQKKLPYKEQNHDLVESGKVMVLCIRHFIAGVATIWNDISDCFVIKNSDFWKSDEFISYRIKHQEFMANHREDALTKLGEAVEPNQDTVIGNALNNVISYFRDVQNTSTSSHSNDKNSVNLTDVSPQTQRQIQHLAETSRARKLQYTESCRNPFEGASTTGISLPPAFLPSPTPALNPNTVAPSPTPALNPNTVAPSPTPALNPNTVAPSPTPALNPNTVAPSPTPLLFTENGCVPLTRQWFQTKTQHKNKKCPIPTEVFLIQYSQAVRSLWTVDALVTYYFGDEVHIGIFDLENQWGSSWRNQKHRLELDTAEKNKWTSLFAEMNVIMSKFTAQSDRKSKTKELQAMISQQHPSSTGHHQLRGLVQALRSEMPGYKERSEKLRQVRVGGSSISKKRKQQEVGGSET